MEAMNNEQFLDRMLEYQMELQQKLMEQEWKIDRQQTIDAEMERVWKIINELWLRANVSDAI